MRGSVSDRGNPPIVNDGLLRHSIPRNDETRSVPARLSGKNQNGGAIVWILIAVALFAALNFAINKGTRSGATNISAEQARLAATDIIAYGELMKRTVQTLQINGCSDTDISFENSVVAGYSNPNAPTDNSCHIYNINGGGLTFYDPPEQWFTTTNPAWVNGETSIKDIGTSDPELILWFNALNDNICNEIENKIRNRDASDETVSVHTVTDGFIGAYTTALSDNIGDDVGNLYESTLAGCITNTGTYPTAFYQVLIVR